MTQLSIYQVDAFASRVFGGNPAAVMPLETWLPEETLQALAMENNLAETAFFVAEQQGSEADFHIRWFTPRAEVPLCGHATLASAWVLFHRLGWQGEHLRFRSKSGTLGVRRLEKDRLELDFPALAIRPVAVPDILARALPEVSSQVFEVPHDTNLMVVLDSEDAVRRAKPDMTLLKTLDNQGVIITAPGDQCDFVSRYFAPALGIDEDPVTGSIHSALVPYWASRLDRTRFRARQLSARGGELECELRGDRVSIAGPAILYMEGRVILA
ncbi:phenazine biosynthesis protein PhzF family [Marinobacter daqiaonensis]|uniref:Phenazine biosynthesis protein PhzF family n=1 Tax=Marinobacter daqiaonensis TaxID=650891 RepID=A0A1I6IDE8_9GAMM|nr:PhzF family phenazine biosynthesis protein [Marinobacter daqiaonensis]SFR64380.1 phenazine biosynthesis protein PhzF family [Marinobacter daqiaonensis]